MAGERTDELDRDLEEYQRLTDKKLLSGLSAEEEHELVRLTTILDVAEAPFYKHVLTQLRQEAGE